MNDNLSNPEYYRYHNNTDWQKLIFNRSYTKNVYLKVTGGDNIAKYALSLGFMNNGGITRNTDLTRYNMRFNGDLNLSRRMTATTNLSFGFNEQNLRDQGNSPNTNPIFVALTKSIGGGYFAEWSTAFLFLVVTVALIIRPTGVFGRGRVA